MRLVSTLGRSGGSGSSSGERFKLFMKQLEGYVGKYTKHERFKLFMKQLEGCVEKEISDIDFFRKLFMKQLEGCVGKYTKHEIGEYVGKIWWFWQFKRLTALQRTDPNPSIMGTTCPIIRSIGDSLSCGKAVKG
ncbi:hypothetical protein F2Q69_00012773 [Brassica cretica]|uniref:Uncharacterized protein n=1 Tax=Brassica cretica TaxID=69181 RepID=A0A8S9QMZ1_BRACR|nr:hypothetical protein F2Q69_00012773 [Brassica cretica]